MPLTDRTLIFDPSELTTHVEPVVLFAIIDHYSRRDEGQDFVVGTLLGTEEGNVVTISSSFPVPHTEVEKDQIALNSDFHATMLGLQQKVTPKQKVVGWYATGESINDTTTLFHDFYGQDVERPVHLLFDLGLGERRMSCKAYVSNALTLGDTRVATAFRDVSLTVVSGESDRVGTDTLLRMTGSASATGAGSGGSAAGELDSVEQTVKKLLRTLEGAHDLSPAPCNQPPHAPRAVTHPTPSPLCCRRHRLRGEGDRGQGGRRPGGRALASAARRVGPAAADRAIRQDVQHAGAGHAHDRLPGQPDAHAARARGEAAAGGHPRKLSMERGAAIDCGPGEALPQGGARACGRRRRGE